MKTLSGVRFCLCQKVSPNVIEEITFEGKMMVILTQK